MATRRTRCRPGAAERPRGFTLIELVTASAIASVILAAATASVVAVHKATKQAERRAWLDSETKLLTEYMLSRLQPVGGGGLRPWSAVTVTDNWDGSGTDRITFLEIDTSFAECIIENVPGSGVVMRFPTGGCCLQSSAAADGRQVVATSQNGANTRQLQVGNATVSAGTCQANFPPGVNTELNHGNGSDGDLSVFTGGTVHVVTTKRIYLNTTTHQLLLEAEDSDDGTPTVTVLADEIYDFQVAMGYDAGIADGDITDTSTNTDEWLYNTVGEVSFTYDSSTSQWSGGITDADPTDLRMMAVGIAMGVKARENFNAVKLLNGPVVSGATFGRYLRGTIGRVTLRNLALFDL